MASEKLKFIILASGKMKWKNFVLASFLLSLFFLSVCKLDAISDIACLRPKDVTLYKKYWQRLSWNQGDIHLWKAYYDDRRSENYVRIIAMATKKVKPNIFCYLWFNRSDANSKDAKPTNAIIVDGKHIIGWKKSWGRQPEDSIHLDLISCPIPSYGDTVPESVSIATNETCAKLENNLQVIPRRREENESADRKEEKSADRKQIKLADQKKTLAVCVKGMDFIDTDISNLLLEWIEFVKILGASHIFLYQFSIHPNMEKVVEYYAMKGYVTMVPISLPGDQPNRKRRRHRFLEKDKAVRQQNELLPLNDCLYRNIYSYKYVLILDIDEMIVPSKYVNWIDMLDNLKSRNNSSTVGAYKAPHVMFLPSERKNKNLETVPQYLTMMKRLHRFAMIGPTRRGKSFYNTEKVLVMNNHHPELCLPEDGAKRNNQPKGGTKCKVFLISPKSATMNHYRPTVATRAYANSNVVKDTTALKYFDELASNVEKTMIELNIM